MIEDGWPCGKGDDEEHPCRPCNLALNGRFRYEDHVRSYMHRRRLRRIGAPPKKRGKGVEVPPGTAILIEQNAILEDATSSYMLALYAKAALRARL